MAGWAEAASAARDEPVVWSRLVCETPGASLLLMLLIIIASSRSHPLSNPFRACLKLFQLLGGEGSRQLNILIGPHDDAVDLDQQIHFALWEPE